MSRFKEGMRVRILANEEEGWGEEFGVVHTVEDDCEMLIVAVDSEFISGSYDDGIREVSEEFVEAM